MKRLMMAVVAACAAVTGFSDTTLPASAYIQRGLVVLLDGIENVGAGLPHDPNATTWVNLGSDGANSDMTLTANGSFEENALRASNNKAGATDDSPYAGVLGTMELFYTMYETYTLKLNLIYTTGRMQMTPHKVEGLHWTLATRPSDTGFLCDYNKVFQPGGTTLDYTGTHGASWSEHGGRQLVYDGVALVAKEASAYMVGGTPGTASVGAFDNNANPVVGGLSMHAIRLYSVKLTSSEVAYNLAIDRIRFQGADPAEAMPEGYRWNAQTQKAEALVKVNFDSSKGSVTANGASIASGWEKWTEVGAGGTVTLTATAGDGAFFKGWTGAPDGVDPGSATITLPADSVATVTAEFILPIWVATDGNDDTGDGGGSAPFATIAKGIEAAKAKIAAGAEDATVCIKDGSYASPFATLDGAIAVIGNVARPSKVVITDETPGSRAFELTHEGAKVAGVKITGKGLQASNGSGGHIRMSAGTVEDSIIENGFAGQKKTSGWGGNVHMTGGTLRRCRVRNGQTTDLANDPYGYGGNISVGAGSACLIENCLVTGGKVNSVYSAAGIGIQKNTSTKVVNCTIVGNTGVANGYGGIHTVPSQTRVIGCVIYGNGGTAKAEWGNANAGSFINCATSADAAFTGGTDNINTVTDAAFLNYANGKYRPREDGVLVGKGLVWEDYLLHATSRTDLSGRPRGKSTNPVDIGCYSANGNGLAIFVR